MVCKYCFHELPEGSLFCPYCLKKFTPETAVTPEKISKRKSPSATVIIAGACIFVLLLSAALASLFRNSEKNYDNTSTESVSEAAAEPSGESGEPSSSDGSGDEGIKTEYGVTSAVDNRGNTYYPLNNVTLIDESGLARNGYIVSDD